MSNQSFIDYYEILHLEPTASTSEISKSYRKLALKCHPDKHPDDKKALEEFQRITEAKNILIDPKLRGEYDAKRKVAMKNEMRKKQLSKEQQDFIEKLNRQEQEEIKKRNETAKYNFMTKNEYEINEIRKKDEKLKEKLFRQKEQTEKEETKTDDFFHYPDRYFDPEYGKRTLERLKKEAEKRNSETMM